MYDVLSFIIACVIVLWAFYQGYITGKKNTEIKTKKEDKKEVERNV